MAKLTNAISTRLFVLLLALWFAGLAPAHNERSTLGAGTPEALAALVLNRFTSGTPEDFAAVCPDSTARSFVADAVYKKNQRRGGIGRVVWRNGQRAVLVLSGITLFGNSGDETIFSRSFSGFYEAIKSQNVWTISRRLPIDASNHIHSHELDVTITPGHGLEVVDNMQITIAGRNGFAVRLNHRAKISSMRLDGKAAMYEFGGGLLWIQAAERSGARLTITYSLDVEHYPDGSGNFLVNSGNFLANAGHVRNQYFWHPFFDFNSAGDRANFSIQVRGPAEFHVTTSIPQSESVAGGTRIIRGQSLRPTFALSLLYDKDWQVSASQIGDFRFETFLTADFKPIRSELETRLRHTYDLLSARFGPPKANYFAVAQSRTRMGNGWAYRSNDLVVAGALAGNVSSAAPRPGAYFGHEISHAWTSPTGAASNFLSEGWATYAEALLLADEFGPQAESAFWESERNYYFIGDFEGRRTILKDPNNEGISYFKGAWILRMLNFVIGETAFQKGMRDYMGIAPGKPAGLDEFTAAMNRATGRDISSFIKPWLTELVVPDISARIENERVVLVQSGPVFEIPLELELTTPNGKLRRTVQMSHREVSLDLSGLAPIAGIRIDPDHHLLIKRHFGETVRLELRAPEAQIVKVAGSFSSQQIPAQLIDTIWKVDLPLTEGHYVWYWVIDGKPEKSATGTAVISICNVQPNEPLVNAYPR